MNTLVKNHLHSKAKINGISCDWEGLQQLISSFAKSKESYLQKTADFLTQWLARQESLYDSFSNAYRSFPSVASRG